MEKMITVPMATLEMLAESNETDVLKYRESGLESMASWCEGRANVYRNLITVYGS